MLALFYQHWYESKKTQVVLYIDLIVAVSLFFLISIHALYQWLPLLIIQTMGFVFTGLVIFNLSSNKTSEEISFALAPEDNSI